MRNVRLVSEQVLKHGATELLFENEETCPRTRNVSSNRTLISVQECTNAWAALQVIWLGNEMYSDCVADLEKDLCTCVCSLYLLNRPLSDCYQLFHFAHRGLLLRYWCLLLACKWFDRICRHRASNRFLSNSRTWKVPFSFKKPFVLLYQPTFVWAVWSSHVLIYLQMYVYFSQVLSLFVCVRSVITLSWCSFV